MPSGVKLARFESIVKDTINKALTNEVKNKIASNATVTSVQLTNDLSVARIYLDCLNRENIDKIISNVEKVKGFLRTKVAHALNAYKAPELRFFADSTIDYANKIEQLLNEIKEKEGK
ncbi:30S ribosome-binding factor RbfA [Ureaplasma ceti]|uniref:Ribosome-binding factor A n=1 Tax=Ureaplasma ceti TaxID=3119530 RepID=A0ABP9U633_9BACT